MWISRTASITKHGKRPLIGASASAILAILILVGASAAYGDIHYVSHSGSNTYPHTSWATATDSIRLAIDAASEWDTVRVAAGSYTCDSLPLKKGMALIGAGMDSTYVRHNGTYFGLLVLADSSYTRGFHFDGRVDTGFGGTLTYRLGVGVGAYTDVGATFTNNRLTNVEDAFLLLFNGLNDRSKRVWIDSNEVGAFYKAIDAVGTSTKITHNIFHIQDESIASTIRQDGMNAEICGNWFFKNVTGSGNGILDLTPVDTVNICNNLFVADTLAHGAAIWINRLDPDRIALGEVSSNTIVGGEFGIFRESSAAQARNNILTMIRRADISPQFTGDSLVRYNLFWCTRYGNAKDTADYVSRHNIFVNPMLVDSVNYILQAFSPAIDAGDPTILDRDGTRSDMGYAGGPGGFSYAYQDLPPQVPSGLRAQNVTGAVAIVWSPNTEADLYSYNIYRDTSPIQVSSSAILLAAVQADTSYLDSAIASEEIYYYRVTALDAQLYESGLSSEVVVAISGISEPLVLPAQVRLGDCFPNPFNVGMTIPLVVSTSNSVPSVHVQLDIFNISGQRVLTLYKGCLSAGVHLFKWNGRGRSVKANPSGIYFVQLQSDYGSQIQRVILLK